MADPLRVPAGWTGDSRALIRQLQEEREEQEATIRRLKSDMTTFRSGANNLKFVAGCLRYPNPGDTWIFLDGGGHHPLNIDHVSVTDMHVNIYYTFTAKNVIALTATADEYYTQLGVSCGASVGVSSSAVYFRTCPDTGYTDPMTLRSNNANVWILGIFEV